MSPQTPGRTRQGGASHDGGASDQQGDVLVLLVDADDAVRDAVTISLRIADSGWWPAAPRAN